MELTPRQLAFLEHEMKKIMDDDSRRQSEKSHASSVLGRIEGELESEAYENQTGSADKDELSV
ncbi:hypothetical protein [Halarchaeum acidiphilum]|uniref:hypothetical protein n=1 Tax=Halarchaeum acidiphilum TaxID=489138 RepID=UPI000361999C|nr:hypothetical protein [Halarchaeum acidiphilum]